MISPDQLINYITGMRQQLSDAEKNAHMIEGALQFAQQLLDDLEKEETEVCEPLPSLDSHE